MRSLAAVGTVVALMAMAAPAASAETIGPGDAAGCTTTYVNEVGGPYILPNPPTVSYTPPANITIDADDTVNFALGLGTHVANATIAYVICVG